MSIYNIVTKEDKLLRKVCKPVPEITPNVKKLLDNMLETMYESNGVGLAAPQVGILKRVVVVDIGEEGPGPLKLINPEILERSGEQNGPEGCLSCPGMWGDVKRSKYVKVKALTPEGQEIIIEGEDYLARALQHEIDHLDGILFIDTATNIEYQR
ncbi:MAG: peptide deformylase [Peptococcaceae bacterium]